MTKDELTKKTIKELVVLARRKGLRGVSRLRKSQLIAKLLEATSGPPSSRPPRRAHLSPRVSRKAAAGLTQQTRTQLLAVAKQRGLTGVSRLRKAELLARLAGDPFSVPPPVPPVPSTPSAPEPLPPAELPPVAAPQPVTATIGAPQTPQPPPGPAYPQELPSGYQDTRVVLLARDPHQLYAYWDLPPEQIAAGQPARGAGQFVARVIAVADPHTTNGRDVTALALPVAAAESYIPVPQPATSYRVEVGYRTADGHFTVLGRSNVATTPPAETSASTAVQWFTPPGYVPSFPSATLTHLLPSPLSREPGSWHLGPGAPGPSPLPAPLVPSVPSSWSFGR
jgi:hypothetical protein